MSSSRGNPALTVLRSCWQRVTRANYGAVPGVIVRGWRRIASRPILSGAVAVASLISVGALLLAAGVFDVRHVTIVGADKATTARIQAMAKTVVGDSVFTADTSSLRHRVADLPQIADVHVSRTWPNAIRVTVTERKPTFAVHQATGWMLIDQSATPYLTVARPPAHVLPLTTPDITEGNPTLHAAVEVVSSLPAGVRKTVIAVDAPSTDGIRLRMRGGTTVVWGGPEDSARKARALAVLLHRTAHVYDVSTPGLVTTS